MDSACPRANRRLLLLGVACVGASFALPSVARADEPRLAIGDAAAAEPPIGSGVISLLVSLSAPATTPVILRFDTVQDSATLADFTPLSGVLEIPVGSQRALIRIPVLADPAVEETEQFFVRLSAVNGAVAARSEGRASILHRVRDKDGWSEHATVSLTVVPSNSYDQWRRIDLPLPSPTPATEPDQPGPRFGQTFLEAYFFLDQLSGPVPPDPPVLLAPVRFVVDELGRPGVMFAARQLTDITARVEATSSLTNGRWETLASWKGRNLLSLAPGVQFMWPTAFTVLETAPPSS